MKTFPYSDISDPERRRSAESYGFTITDRDGIGEALGLSPNRISELTLRDQLVACNKNPLRYEVEHNKSCYYSYKCAVKEGWTQASLSPED